MKIFVLDNYDSFTYNLVHILEQFATCVEVKRNDSICVEDIVGFDKIVFSPGPGIPSDVKIMFDILDAYKESKSILGVCLGHQAIAEYFGSTLLNMSEVNHGREFKTKIISTDYLYNNIPSEFNTGRYHSWIVSENNLPNNLEITSADSINNNIMSLKHKELNIRGVQYHPESIMTKYGSKILENWVNY
jgi:anthranilate synthase component 2